MIEHLLGIFTFLLGMLLALTLGYGYYHKNKYIQIYSICAIAWIGFIYFGNMEIFGVVLLRFHELLNLIGIILPPIPLWFIYHKRDRTEERIESARLKRQHGYRFKGDTELFDVFLNAGGKKCPKCGSTNFKIMRNYQIFECMAKECRWLYIDETNRMNQLLNPELQPLTEAQKRQIALEKEREKKEAEKRKKEFEKLVKGWADGELIDKYIEWDELMENVEIMGSIPEFEVVEAEVKRRNISSRRIEKRRSELDEYGRKKHY